MAPVFPKTDCLTWMYFFVLCYQAWLALLGVVCIGLAIGVSFGLASAFGVFYGPVHSTLPFLLLGKIT